MGFHSPVCKVHNRYSQSNLKGNLLLKPVFQVRLLKKYKFLIEKDHSEKEMAVQVHWFQ